MTRLYISGTPSGSDRFLEEEAARSEHRLFSLHGNYMPAVMKWIEKAKGYAKRPRTILLDSGAFTAWNKGHKTSVTEVITAYSKFIEAAEGMFDEIWGINLDVIPGERERDPTAEEIQQAVAESDANLRVLQQHFGNMILPVFHQGESTERLDEVVQQAEFICISPRNDLNESQRVKWAREVHMHTNPKKTHGLATTGVHMLTVPWFSVDSATSIHVAAYGMLIFHVDGTLKKIFVTRDSDKHKYVDKHFDTLNPYLKHQCSSLMQQDIFTHDELMLYVKARTLFNIKQLNEFTRNKVQYNVEQYSLFGV